MPGRLTPLLLAALAAAALAQPGVSGAGSHVQDKAPSGRTADEVFRQLLYMPAPTPRAAQTEGAEPAEEARPANFYAQNQAPPDDAPTKDLVDYWERWAGSSGRERPKPSEAVRRRLLAACEAGPESLPRLIALLPDAPETAERVKKLYDAAQGDERFDEGWRKAVREWLQFNSAYFLSDLLSAARKAGDKAGYVDKEEALKALAKVDWGSAEPLLRSLSGGGQPRTAALALALLHRHALDAKDSAGEEHFRSLLQSVASDRSAPARARDTAVDELSQTQWPGRDDWYLSLFTDKTLLQPTDGHYLFSPLTALFDGDPDRWIPVMAKLVESNDPAVRQNAASCLVQYATNRPRRDAILPVLRWLSDPDWLDIGGTQYAWFMQAMDDVAIPESVPGLIWIVEHDESNRRWAARTLAHYKDPRAVPALKKALADEKDQDDRHFILQGLVASGGLTEPEQLAALEAYAAKIAAGQRAETEPYHSAGEEPLPLPLSIGNYLARQEDAPESLVRAVLARAGVLRKKNPAQARALLGVAEGWQARQVEVDMLRRIGAGAADAATIANALERRARLRETVTAELQLLAGAGGAARGVAAVLLADDALTQAVLDLHDKEAQVALLACARLTQTPLPVAQVGTLMRGKSPSLQLAAERYLLAEDSAEARALLWARHAGEAFVTGWRENIPLIGGNDFSAMGRAEERLRAELFRGEDAPVEIFALLGNDERPSRVLRVYRDRAVYTHNEDAARYREAVVTAEQLSRFRQFLAASNLPDMGPRLAPCHHDCWASEFLSLRREAGRRVFSHQGLGGWMNVIFNFDALSGEGAKVHYRLADKVKGLEVLVADDSLTVRDVWQRGDDVRVLVERGETAEEAARRQREEDEESEEDEDDATSQHVKRRRQEFERESARVSWRSFDGGRLSAAVPRPEGYSTPKEEWMSVDWGKFPVHLNGRPARARAGNYFVLAGAPGEGGLWKVAPGREPVRLGGEGAYANPLTTPDGVWAVAARADSDWGRPNDLVRFDLRTGREYRVNIPPAEQFNPVAYVASQGRVLLRRARDEGERREPAGPASPEFYLLDVATGQTQSVTGVFEPLMQEGDRGLQAAVGPGEFWAAVPDRGKHETRVGRYSTKDFTFRTLLVVPHITFESFQMWVDEAGAKLYVVYDGQLLRLPMPKAP